MKKINPLFISGCLLFMVPAMSATLSGTLAPTVVPLTNGGQANIAVSNTDPNLFTVPGDRITAINSLDGGLTSSPDCRGITVAELQGIDFNELDFTNFMEDLINNQKIPDNSELTEKTKARIKELLTQSSAK